MKKTPALALALLAVVLSTASAARAQGNAVRSVTTKIDFAFVLNGKTLPAGSYTLEADESRVILRPQAGKAEGVIASVMTRLGRHDRDADPELVFDSIEGKYLLSEVWLPGEDGYLLLGTKERHDHRVIGGSNAHK